MFYKLCLYVLGFQNKRGEAPRERKALTLTSIKVTSSDSYTILKNYSYGLLLS